MGIFRKKTVAATTTASTDDQPKPAPYRHIPSHAASDSMSNGGQNAGTLYDRQRIELESRRRMKFAIANEANASDAAYLQAMARGVLPRSHSSLHSYSGTPRGPLSRNSSGYFAPSMPHIADMDEDHVQAATKLDAEGNNLHWSSDSGYGSATPSSAINSRTPSEHGKLDGDVLDASAPVKRADSYLSISATPINEAELSETSSDDAPVEMAPKKTHRGVLKVRRASPASDDDLAADTRSIRSVRSTRSTSKQTRFEHPDEAVPPVPVQHRQEFARQESHRRQKEQGVRSSSPNAASDTPQVSVSVLEGYKVNSRGQILNEEAELLGMLVEGDLLECVRQRIDSTGHVVDATGSVVGRVEVAPKNSEPADAYAYRGEIPAVDAASPYVNFMHQRAFSTGGRIMPPSFQRHASTGMLVLNSTQPSFAGRRGMGYAVGVPGARPLVSTRHSYSASARRSPLASTEHSPVTAKVEGDLADIPDMPISRAMSVRTIASGRTVQAMEPSKPRTYFTHGGKITVDTTSLASVASDATATVPTSAPAKSEGGDKTGKRKGRFSAMFHKKK